MMVIIYTTICHTLHLDTQICLSCLMKNDLTTILLVSSNRNLKLEQLLTTSKTNLVHRPPSIQPHEELRPPSAHPLDRHSPLSNPLDHHQHPVHHRPPSANPSEHRLPSSHERHPPSALDHRPPSANPSEHRLPSAHERHPPRPPSILDRYPPSTHPKDGTRVEGHPKIPGTKITPPTPAKPDHDPPASHGNDDVLHLFGPENDAPAALADVDTLLLDQAGSGSDPSMDPMDETQGCAGGRLSDAVKQVRDEGYKEIEKMFAELAERTSIDVDRLISGYYQNYVHRTVAFNSWNVYQIYFKEHRDEEVERTYPPEKQADLDSKYSTLHYAEDLLICY
jgi:hypothetical protein